MNKPKYYVSKEGEFVIENYNSAPPFASFLPGIAGIFGIPMWVFYNNRGQTITSAGVQDKNGAIMEFHPANKAYRLTALQGFRTFIKVDGRFYEPFSERSDARQEMRITADSVKIAEENKKLKLKFEVTYFTLPHEAFPALARILKISNLSSKKRELEVVDGLPVIIPFGFDDSLLKRLSNTIMAWCMVDNLENNAPFYKLKVLPADISETKYLERGNFFISFCQEKQPVHFIVDPKIVFGENLSLEFPDRFMDAKKFALPKWQMTEGFLPSAFAFKRLPLGARETFELSSVFGQSENKEAANKIAKKISSRGYLRQKYEENRKLIDDLVAPIHTESGSQRLDLYAKHTFLDNLMRGGQPVEFGNKTIYLYYRKHGDMERDYNDFNLLPTYFSQGDGNYRDINQNRRNDLFFNPEIGDDNILRFYNLIQLDGFNPLIVLGSKYYLSAASVAEKLLNKHVDSPREELLEELIRPFSLGALLKEMENSRIRFKTSREQFAEELLSGCEIEEGAIHGEGFWTDHFFYGTDLLESFESIYPDRIRGLLFSQKTFTFYDNEHIVLPRADKYRLVDGNVRQYESVAFDVKKAAAINSRPSHKNVVRSAFGKGPVYCTTLAVKLLCIIANKAASFDAEGIGIEMEADKPDWYDALNGLPGLFGSSLSETLELKRLCSYLGHHLTKEAKVALPKELKNFMELLCERLKESLKEPDAFKYWDTTYQIKESFREETKPGLSGQELEVNSRYVADFLVHVIAKCNLGIKKALGRYKNYYTYFINEVSDYETIDGNKVRVKRFRQKPLPLFLEGFVHSLKVEKHRQIYKLVRNSPLYDWTLKMYKVNAPLKDATIEIGRARIFTPGWLENESIWLHMEYKYLLELLKAKMYDEFFNDFKKVLVPFMDPAKYKRSILENSSFIVSSAYPDRENHGRGFVARLSGCSAEFIDMWVTMMTGKNIFYLDDKGKLCFRLSPAIPAWLFKKGKLSFRLLGSVDVTYLNPKNKNTYDDIKPVSYKLIFDDQETEINGTYIKEPHASQIRERKVKKMIVNLG
jgi:hypothetical protein